MHIHNCHCVLPAGSNASSLRAWRWPRPSSWPTSVRSTSWSSWPTWALTPRPCERWAPPPTPHRLLLGPQQLFSVFTPHALCSSPPPGVCSQRGGARQEGFPRLHVHRSGHHLRASRTRGGPQWLHHSDPHSHHAKRRWARGAKRANPTAEPNKQTEVNMRALRVSRLISFLLWFPRYHASHPWLDGLHHRGSDLCGEAAAQQTGQSGSWAPRLSPVEWSW